MPFSLDLMIQPGLNDNVIKLWHGVVHNVEDLLPHVPLLEILHVLVVSLLGHLVEVFIDARHIPVEVALSIRVS